jgi:hypothetical protein
MQAVRHVRQRCRGLEVGGVAGIAGVGSTRQQEDEKLSGHEV